MSKGLDELRALSDVLYPALVQDVNELLVSLQEATDERGLRVDIRVRDLTPLVPEIVQLVLAKRLVIVA